MSADQLEIAMIRREREARGLCPCCEQRTSGWVAPEPSSDTARMLEKRRVDPKTGHEFGCQEG